MDEVDKPQFSELIESFRAKDYINCQAYETWKDSRKEFEDDIQLVWLFKGLVILERELKWIGGSVAGAIWVYRMIQEANLDKDFQIADFGLRTLGFLSAILIMASGQLRTTLHTGVRSQK